MSLSLSLSLSLTPDLGGRGKQDGLGRVPRGFILSLLPTPS